MKSREAKFSSFLQSNVIQDKTNMKNEKKNSLHCSFVCFGFIHLRTGLFAAPRVGVRSFTRGHCSPRDDLGKHFMTP